MFSVRKRNPIEVLKQCQLAYDHQSPPEHEEECNHNWSRIGSAEDGTTFVRCTKCKIEEEV